VALRVIGGLTSRRPAEVIVNTRNGSAVPFLDGDDVVEVPALVDGAACTRWRPVSCHVRLAVWS